jgi:crossover junction endodeoxyribonuclease RusA
MEQQLSFVVLGVAQPKGSARAFVPKGWTRPIITSANKSLKGWETAVRDAIQQHAPGVWFEGAVVMRIHFELPRPKAVRWPAKPHLKRPDLDKLVRGTLDAMTKVLWHDDSQVISITASKSYALDQSCALIEVHGSQTLKQEQLHYGEEGNEAGERSIADILEDIAQRDARRAEEAAAEGAPRTRRPRHRRD